VEELAVRIVREVLNDPVWWDIAEGMEEERTVFEMTKWALQRGLATYSWQKWGKSE